MADDHADDLEKLEKIMVMLDSAPERHAAANALVNGARQAGIDLRDLRLRLANGEDDELAASRIRIAEYERMMQLAYPDEAKLVAEINVLKQTNRDLRAALKHASSKRGQVTDEARADYNAAKALRNEAQRLNDENFDKHPLIAWLRSALVLLAPDPYRQQMSDTEMRQSIEDAGRDVDETLRKLRYDHTGIVPPWMRVLVRSLGPPPTRKRKGD